MRAKFVPPKKGTIDEIGELDEQIKALEERREKLMARLGKKKIGLHLGESFKASVYESTSTWLDHGRVRRRLGMTEFKKCWKSKEVRQVRITKLKE